MTPRPAAQPRVALFDLLKCVSLCSMIVYHTVYDLVFIFGVELPWFRSQGAFLWQQSICWTFILVSGALQPASRRPVRHGLVLLGCGLLLTAVTLLVLPQEQILFGILHFLGCAALFSALLPALAKLPAAPAALVCFLLFAVTYDFPLGFLGFFGKHLVQLPAALYASPWLFPLGLMPVSGFYSSDYFPLVPWLFLYWTGLFLWRAVRGTRLCAALEKMPQCPVCGWISRRSLLLYLLHQPVVYGVCLLIFN